jgi:hypothetical protein
MSVHFITIIIVVYEKKYKRQNKHSEVPSSQLCSLKNVLQIN